MRNTECTCLLPVFNEGERALKTLSILGKIPSISKIVYIDDGSTDSFLKIVKRKYPQVTIISLPQNQGKTAAIKIGLKEVGTSHVLLFDADLQNCRPDDFNKGVQYILNHSDLDMLIFIRSKDISSVYTGERILKTNILRESLAHYEAKGFQLEAAINQYCLDHHKKVLSIPTAARNTYQIIKAGFIQGWINNISTVIEIIKLIGIKNYLRQIYHYGKYVHIN